VIVSAVGTLYYQFGSGMTMNCEMQFVLDCCKKITGCRGIPVVINAYGIDVSDLLVEPSLAETNLPYLCK